MSTGPRSAGASTMVQQSLGRRDESRSFFTAVVALALIIASRNIIASVLRDSDDARDGGPSYPPGVATALSMQACSWVASNDRPIPKPHEQDMDSLAADELIRHIDEVWFGSLRLVYSLSGASLFDAYQHATRTGGERSIYLLHSSYHDRLTVFSMVNQATKGTRFALQMPHDSREVPGLSKLRLVHKDHPRAVISIDLLPAALVASPYINRSTAVLPFSPTDGQSHDSEAAATLSFRAFSSICRCPSGPVWANCPERVPTLMYLTLLFGTTRGAEAPPPLATDPALRPMQPLQAMRLCLSRTQCRLPDSAPLAYEARVLFALLALGSPLSVFVWASSRLLRRPRPRLLAAPLFCASAAFAALALRRICALPVLADAIALAALLQCSVHTRALAQGKRPPPPHLVLALYAASGAWMTIKGAWLDPNRCIDLAQWSFAGLAVFASLFAVSVGGKLGASMWGDSRSSVLASLALICVHVASSAAQGSAWC